MWQLIEPVHAEIVDRPSMRPVIVDADLADAIEQGGFRRG